MIQRMLSESRLPYPMDSPKGLPNNESFMYDEERLAMNWIIHQARGVIEWEQEQRDAAIARRPAIFEIGTFWGLSLVEFSRMVPGIELHSLDVGPEGIPGSPQQSIESIDKLGWYARARGVSYQQYVGSSLQFDFSRFKNPFDVVFIDGRHDKRHVDNDTQKTLPMLAAGGVMVWHDYKEDDIATIEMVGALKELDRTEFDGNLTHIAGTSLVFWVKR